MKILRHIFLLLIMAGVGAGITYAAFSSQAKIKGASFSTGKAEILLSRDNAIWSSTISDAFIFQNIVPNWQEKYSLLVKNNGTTPLNLFFYGHLNGLGSADKDDLRKQIKLQISQFVDANHNGQWDSGEALTTIGTEKTLDQINDAENGFAPIDLGIISPSDGAKGYLLTFSAGELDGKQNANFSGYEFIFDATTNTSVTTPTLTPTPT